MWNLHFATFWWHAEAAFLHMLRYIHSCLYYLTQIKMWITPNSWLQTACKYIILRKCWNLHVNMIFDFALYTWHVPIAKMIPYTHLRYCMIKAKQFIYFSRAWKCVVSPVFNSYGWSAGGFADLPFLLACAILLMYHICMTKDNLFL